MEIPLREKTKERKTMSNKRRLFVPGTVACFGFLVVSAANAQTPTECYTVGSLRGYYSIIGNYGANVATALGMRYFDGNGNLTGTFVVNEPTAGSTTGARTIVTGTQVGTYTVNCNGTGQIQRVVTASNGITTNQTDDFVITAAVAQPGNYLTPFLAMALTDAQETPSAIVAGGIFLTRSYSRLPDRFGPIQP
jgi:hypothetical protein